MGRAGPSHLHLGAQQGAQLGKPSATHGLLKNGVETNLRTNPLQQALKGCQGKEKK